MTAASPWRARLLNAAILAVTVAPLSLSRARGWLAGLALGLSLVAAGLRLLSPRSGAGGLVSFALGAVALVVAGQDKLGWPYGLSAAAFVALSVASLGGAAPPMRLDRRGRRFGLVAVVAAAGLGGLGAVAIPRLEGVAQRVLGRFLLEEGPVTGFSDRMRLGAMHDMLESDDVALRVFGAPTDYLRGAVYDDYEGGRWLGTGWPSPVALVAHAAGGSSVVIEQEAGRSYFLPLGACAVGGSDGPVVSDGAGIVTPASAVRASRAWFDPTCHAAAAPVLGPRDADLAIPRAVRPSVQRLAALWTSTGSSPLDKARDIERHLRSEYRYSLESSRDLAADPLVDFLERHREGHCEYFASAMVLLGRAAGLPSRVVGGYRVGERNPLGGWWVVRQRNAHAWAEIWVDGAWRTFDPTPPSAIEAARAGGLVAAISDVAARAWQRATPVQLGLAAALLGGGLSGWLALRRRRERRGRSPALSARAPPTLTRLEGALARRGHVRPAWEPIEQFASRLADGSAGAVERDGAELLLRYARQRYGGQGDLAQLAEEVDRFSGQADQA